MSQFIQEDFENLQKCPWCESEQSRPWGSDVRGFESVKCEGCKIIYVKNRLNRQGLSKYYKNYLSEVHQADKTLNKQRDVMYRLEYDLLLRYWDMSSVLDVGCSGGYFLDFFRKDGYECFGVEFGEAAAREAAQKFLIYIGDFPELDIERTFDLIIFRGVIEHILNPKAYLKKAVGLLNDEGMIYITSTPNADSFCAELFKEQWRLHTPEEHIIHFTPRHFDAYFQQQGLRKVNEYCFYEETPYADLKEDIKKVNEAIELTQSDRSINFQSPPFWGNMMSLIYQK